MLHHALGRDENGRRPRGSQYDTRSHFVADPGSADHAACERAVAQGLMTRRPGSDIYIVTTDGREYVAAHTPRMVLSPAKQRYAEFLESGGALPFGEWLKARHRLATGRTQ